MKKILNVFLTSIVGLSLIPYNALAYSTDMTYEVAEEDGSATFHLDTLAIDFTKDSLSKDINYHITTRGGNYYANNIEVTKIPYYIEATDASLVDSHNSSNKISVALDYDDDYGTLNLKQTVTDNTTYAGAIEASIRDNGLAGSYVGRTTIIFNQNATKQPVSEVKGDVNLDTVLNNYDAIAIEKVLKGQEAPLTGQSLINADINGDGQVTYYDLYMVQGYLDGSISESEFESGSHAFKLEPANQELVNDGTYFKDEESNTVYLDCNGKDYTGLSGTYTLTDTVASFKYSNSIIVKSSEGVTITDEGQQVGQGATASLVIDGITYDTVTLTFPRG